MWDTEKAAVTLLVLLIFSITILLSYRMHLDSKLEMEKIRLEHAKLQATCE